MTGVDTASHEDARLATIKVRCTEEELTGTVTIAIAPRFFKVRLTTLKAGAREVDYLIGNARCTVTIHKELLTVVGKPFDTSGLRRTVVSP